MIPPIIIYIILHNPLVSESKQLVYFRSPILYNIWTFGFVIQPFNYYNRCNSHKNQETFFMIAYICSTF